MGRTPRSSLSPWRSHVLSKRRSAAEVSAWRPGGRRAAAYGVRRERGPARTVFGGQADSRVVRAMVSCTREDTSSLVNTDRRWVPTVLAETCNWAAADLLV